MPTFNRTWVLACFAMLATFGPDSVAPAQEREAGQPAGQRGNHEVINTIPGQTTILTIKPDGSRVEKGDLVCELDPFLLKKKLAPQEVATRAAESAYENAKRDRQVAELSVVEYVEGTYKQELGKLNGMITLAEAELKRAEVQLEKSRRLSERGILPRDKVTSDQLAVQRAKLALEKAQSKKMVLEKYTKEKKVKTLQSAVERARSLELANQAAQEREQAAQQRLLKQIESCKVLAPVSGRLSYGPPIEPGADVGEGQLLFRVIPEDAPKAGVK